MEKKKFLIGNIGYKKYLVVRKNAITIDKKKIEEEKRFDGKLVLTTNKEDWKSGFFPL